MLNRLEKEGSGIRVAGNTLIRGLVFATIVLLLGAAVVSAQTTATISGTVSDQKGGLIANAQVTITNMGTGQTRTVQADDAGRYYAAALPPGEYQLSATAPGFEKLVRSGVTLTVGSEVVIDLTLSPGQVTEQIQVKAEAPLVQTTNATLAELVGSEKIRALPLNGRSFDQLIYLQPGVNVATAAGSSPNQGRGTKFSVGGARLTSNVFMLDGTDMNDSQNFTPGGAGGQLFGIESIREFQVITHNATAQYGRSMGGIINAVSQSGTNSFHGDAFEFLRNSALDAKNFFDDPNAPIPSFSRNQFGGSIGGPIRRDRLFFFANYEGLREDLGVTKFAFVPDADARNGRIINRVTGAVTNITVNDAVKPYLNLIPAANGPNVLASPGVANLQFSQQQPSRVDYVTGRADWNPNEKDSFFARYTIDNSSKLRQDAADHILGLFAEDETHRNQYVTLQAMRIISPTVLNQVRFGFNRSVTLVNLFNQADVPDSLAFIPGQPFGRITVKGGLSPIGATINDPRFFRMNSFQPSDDLSITRGPHALKTGVFIERFQWNTANFNRIGGDYQFSSLANFLQAKADSVQVPFPGSEPNRGIRATLFAGYLQDDWRVSRRLTLNLGLRYELTTVPTEVNGRMSFLTDPSQKALQITQPFAGNHKNFAPRLGFAWDPQGNGKTSIRGGVGIYYDQILLNQFLNLFDRNPNPDLRTGWLTVTLSSPNAPFPHPLQAAQLSPQFTLQNVVFDDYQTPYTYQYSLTVQRQIANNLVASVAYVGSRGRHIIERFDGNTPIPKVLAGGVPCNSGAVSATNPILPAGTLCIPKGAPKRNPAWGELQTRRLAGLSWYDSLQVSVVRRFSAGLQIQGAYTWSKSLDMSGGLFSEEADNAAVGIQNPDSIFAEKGLSNFDIRHNGVINVLYEFPFGKELRGAPRQFVHGWEIGGIGSFSTGVPFTVENSSNRSQSQLSGANFADRPNVATGASTNPTHGVSIGCTFGTGTSAVTIPAGTAVGTVTHWFDPCAFVPQPLGTFGNLGRNTLIGPGLSTVDFLVNKHFRITEQKEFQFRAEFFNMLNHPNFATPNVNNRRIFDANGNLVASGAISRTTTTSRQIQFGFKFIF
ncbi:MAG TPA: TonB-dependent receptor [Blastocatellia bacterium]